MNEFYCVGDCLKHLEMVDGNFENPECWSSESTNSCSLKLDSLMKEFEEEG